MKEQIEQYRKTAWLGKNIVYEDLMDSTNIRAKVLGKESGMNGSVVIAGGQTAGRGRIGRNWVSPQGNCYFSMLLRPDIRAENASMLTLVMAMAVTEAVGRISGLEPQIKWPNDVVVNGKKICGILTESNIGVDGLRYVVVGAGINTNQSTFDAEIRDVATSITLETGEVFECAQLIAECLNCFEHLYEIFIKTEDLSALKEAYNVLLVNRNREVRIIDKKERTGIALGINELGELLVRGTDGNVERVISGEVSVRGLYGYV